MCLTVQKLPAEVLEFFREQGAKGGRIGGKRSLETMTAEQRAARAKKVSNAAAEARKAKGDGRLSLQGGGPVQTYRQIGHPDQMKLEDLQPNTSVRGILPNALVTVVTVQWFGSEALSRTTWSSPDSTSGRATRTSGGCVR